MIFFFEDVTLSYISFYIISKYYCNTSFESRYFAHNSKINCKLLKTKTLSLKTLHILGGISFYQPISFQYSQRALENPLISD